MRMNRKNTRVLVDKKYTALNLLGYSLIAGIPFGYLSFTQDLFETENTVNKITSWGIIAFGIIALTLWSKIKEAVKDFDTYLGGVGKRAKLPIVTGTISTILVITYVSIGLVLGVTLSITIGGLLSLYPFSLYDNQNEKAKRMTLKLKGEIENKEFNELEELKTLKQQNKKTKATI